MGHECLREIRLRDCIDEIARSIPRLRSRGVGSAQSLQDYIPKQRAYGPGVVGG